MGFQRLLNRMSKSLTNPSNFKQFKYFQEENSTVSTYKATEAGSIPPAGKSTQDTCFDKPGVNTIIRKYEKNHTKSSSENSSLPSSKNSSLKNERHPLSINNSLNNIN